MFLTWLYKLNTDLWPKPKVSNKEENYNYQHRCKGRKGKREEGEKVREEVR